MTILEYSSSPKWEPGFNVVSGVGTMAYATLTGVVIKKAGGTPVAINFTALATVFAGDEAHKTVITNSGKCLVFRCEYDPDGGLALHIVDTVTMQWESSMWIRSPDGDYRNNVDLAEFDETTQLAHLIYQAEYTSMGSSYGRRYYSNYNLTTNAVSSEVLLEGTDTYRLGRIFNVDFTMALLCWVVGSAYYYVNLSTGLTEVTTTGGTWPDYANTHGGCNSVWLRSGASNEAYYSVFFPTNVMQVTAANLEAGTGITPTWAYKYSGTQNTDGVVIGSGCRLNATNTLLYVYCHVDLGSELFRFRMWSIDITGAWNAGVTPTLIFDMALNTKAGIAVTNWELPSGGLYSGSGEAEDAPVLFNMGLTSDPDRVYWEELTPFVSSGTDLILDLLHAGGSLLSLLLSVVPLSRIISTLTSNHNFSGVVIDPKNETYYLELDNGVLLQVPMQWFTIRKSLNSDTGYVELLTTCSVPLNFESLLTDYVGESARLYKQVGSIQSDILNGILGLVSNAKDVLLLKINSVSFYGGSTIEVDAVMFTSVSSYTRFRIPPKTSLNVGDTLSTPHNILKVSTVSTHISLDQSFTEVS